MDAQHRLAIDTALEQRLAQLRAQPFDALAQLPESTAEDAVVRNRRVTFNTLCVRESDGGLSIFVRSDTNVAGGLLRTGRTVGFQASPGGDRRTLTGSEVLDFFG